MGFLYKVESYNNTCWLLLQTDSVWVLKFYMYPFLDGFIPSPSSLHWGRLTHTFLQFSLPLLSASHFSLYSLPSAPLSPPLSSLPSALFSS